MPLFIDIGSHRGDEIAWALEKGYEVHAFEPNIKLRPRLLKFEGRAVINYAAAWDENGKARLYEKSESELPGINSEQGRTLIREKININKKVYDEVFTINIGRYLKDLDQDIDILKIDAEGAEYVILQSILSEGFELKRVRRILMEDHEGYIGDGKWLEDKARVLHTLRGMSINIEEWRGIKNL